MLCTHVDDTFPAHKRLLICTFLLASSHWVHGQSDFLPCTHVALASNRTSSGKSAPLSTTRQAFVLTKRAVLRQDTPPSPPSLPPPSKPPPAFPLPPWFPGGVVVSGPCKITNGGSCVTSPNYPDKYGTGTQRLIHTWPLAARML